MYSVADDSSSWGIERLLDPVAPRLQQVEQELERSFSSPIKTIGDVGRHILQGGGKRLRPLLLLLSSEMLGYRGSKDVTYGVVVELIHTATLVHDDIIDEAAVRRGQTSINYGWGNHLTVLVGDYLYTQSMNMALLEGNLDVLRLLSSTTFLMTEGEILALEQSGRVDLTIDDYFDIVGRKTAALFGAACEIPGHLVQASTEIRRSLFDYGYNLGICFQIVDDMLDFTSSAEVLGKPVLSDLKEGKLTLPLLLALPRASRTERLKLERIASEKSFGSDDPESILEIVRKYDTLGETRRIAREYGDRARMALESFPPSIAREALEIGIEFVLSRDH